MWRRANIKVSSTETGAIFGNVVYEATGASERSVVRFPGAPSRRGAPLLDCVLYSDRMVLQRLQSNPLILLLA